MFSPSDVFFPAPCWGSAQPKCCWISLHLCDSKDCRQKRFILQILSRALSELPQKPFCCISMQRCCEACMSACFVIYSQSKYILSKENTAMNWSPDTHDINTLQDNKKLLWRYKDVHTHADRGAAVGDTTGFVVGVRQGSGISVAHRVMLSVPLRDWLVLEAAGSSLGWAEPMALQGGVLGLPGQQVKHSGESKALHTHSHTHSYSCITNTRHTNR